MTQEYVQQNGQSFLDNYPNFEDSQIQIPEIRLNETDFARGVLAKINGEPQEEENRKAANTSKGGSKKRKAVGQAATPKTAPPKPSFNTTPARQSSAVCPAPPKKGKNGKNVPSSVVGEIPAKRRKVLDFGVSEDVLIPKDLDIPIYKLGADHSMTIENHTYQKNGRNKTYRCIRFIKYWEKTERGVKVPKEYSVEIPTKQIDNLVISAADMKREFYEKLAACDEDEDDDDDDGEEEENN